MDTATTKADGGKSTSATQPTISINGATAGGTVSAPTITITDKGHTHAYTKPTGSGTFTGTEGTTDGGAADIAIGDETVTTASVTQPTISVTDPGHSHTQK